MADDPSLRLPGDGLALEKVKPAKCEVIVVDTKHPAANETELRESAKIDTDQGCDTDEAAPAVPGSVSQGSLPGSNKKQSFQKVRAVSNDVVTAVRTSRLSFGARIDSWIISKGVDPNAVRHALQLFVALLAVCMFMVGPAVYNSEQPDSDKMLRDLYEKGDTDSDGTLNQEEFVAIMTKEESVTTVQLSNSIVLDILPKPLFTWMAITVVLVIESNLGNVLKKSTLRILGTTIGGFCAWVLLKATDMGVDFKNQRKKAAVLMCMVPLVCGTAMFIKDHIKKAEYAFVVGLLTFVLVTMSSWNDQDTKDTGAWDRSINIILGCAIGAFSSLLVFPVRATKLLVRSFKQGSEDLKEFFGTTVSLYSDVVFGDGVDDADEDSVVDGLLAKTSSVIAKVGDVNQYISPAERERCLFCSTSGNIIKWAALCKHRSEATWTVVALLSELDTGIAQTALCVENGEKISRIRQQFSACLDAITFLTTKESKIEDAVDPVGMFAVMVVNFVWDAHNNPGTGPAKQTLMSLASALIAMTGKVRGMLVACSPDADQLLNAEFYSRLKTVAPGSRRESVVIAVMNAIGLQRPQGLRHPDGSSSDNLVSAEPDEKPTRKSNGRFNMLQIANALKLAKNGTSELILDKQIVHDDTEDTHSSNEEWC